MKRKSQLKMAAVLAGSVLAVAGPAAAGTPLDSYRDGPERHSALTSAEAAVAYFRANERATAATSGDAAITYFYANERSQGPVVSEALVGYVDGPERGAPLRSTTPVSPAVAQAERPMPTLKPGLSDFGLSYKQLGAPAQELASGDGGFDWGSAAIGASSVFMLALLIASSLLTARRLRGGPLAR